MQAGPPFRWKQVAADGLAVGEPISRRHHHDFGDPGHLEQDLAAPYQYGHAIQRQKLFGPVCGHATA